MSEEQGWGEVQPQVTLLLAMLRCHTRSTLLCCSHTLDVSILYNHDMDTGSYYCHTLVHDLHTGMQNVGKLHVWMLQGGQGRQMVHMAPGVPSKAVHQHHHLQALYTAQL